MRGTGARYDPAMQHRRIGTVLALGLCHALALAACSRGGLDGSEGATDGAAAADGSEGPDGGPGDGGAGTDLSADASPGSSDPFDAASCGGPALSGAQALPLLGAAPRLKPADATLHPRTRPRTRMTADTCGAWGPPVAPTQSLLPLSPLPH